MFFKIKQSDKQDPNNEISQEQQPYDKEKVQLEEESDGSSSSMNTKTLEEAAQQDKEAENDVIPDGGVGWIVVSGAFLSVITSYGVMQDYYEQLWGDEVSDVQLKLSFVSTFCFIFANLCGPIAQIMRSMWGTRFVLFVGTMFVAVGLIIAGFSTQIWHLYLTQGIMFGTGVSLLYVTLMAVVPQYFEKRRAVALGIVSSGSGIGGLIVPFVMTPINRSLGSGWTYRVVGFICLGCDLITCILVKDRKPLKRQRKKISEVVKISVFKDKNFRIWCLGACVQMFGYYIPYFFLPSYCTWLGLSDAQGSSLISVSSAANFVGRIICGFLADRFGVVNINILFVLISGLSTLLMWSFAYSYGLLMAYSTIFGLVSGSFFALVAPITLNILGVERFPSGLSMVLIIVIISVFGPNIASAIDGGAGAEPYFAYKMFTGVAYIAATFVMLWLKFSINRKVFAKCKAGGIIILLYRI
ncbi:major facilitator superfamily domain-containing protein [Phascolomyces articulosus]|uniref:Major facilitator superfamily domain-containing protein n=1 Tax=Phascolomyces articulosus TaxID=60185 RepID=A0AAD5K010_9FUNG|nr:major facilitator superfamily domain-containing protein [Phascolomyces articulosus]